jgi:hypothetical protein
MMPVTNWWLLGIALLSSGCLRKTEFHCDTSAQCGGDGVCETSVGYCAFPNGECPGGFRYDSSAGALANKCVGEVIPPGEDAGPDTPGDVPTDTPIDVPIDMPPAGCPGGYLPIQINGADSPHLYKVLAPPTQNWDTQKNDCAATSTSAYLAIPDSIEELEALSVLIGADKTYWIGLTDAPPNIEGMFKTLKGADPFVGFPWAMGEPDDTAGGQDCVSATKPTGMATTTASDKCSTKFDAMCECEPP